MSLQTNIARDWQLFDGVVNATLTGAAAQSAGSNVTVTNVKILRRAITRSNTQVFGDVLWSPGDLLIDVWDYRDIGSTNVSVALGRDVRPDDLITVEGTTYQVNQAVYSPMTSRWQCLSSRRLA